MSEVPGGGQHLPGGVNVRGPVQVLEVPGALQHQAGEEQAQVNRAAERGGVSEDTGNRDAEEEDGEEVRGEEY